MAETEQEIKRPFEELVRENKIHPVEAAALRAILPVDEFGLIHSTAFYLGREQFLRSPAGR